MNRVFYHHALLEEYPAGMWRILNGDTRQEAVTKSIALLRDHEALERAMEQVLDQWPFSCEHNLSSENSNRIAWLGQAACCLAHGAGEDCTRGAWAWLTDNERVLANKSAERVLSAWLDRVEPTLFPRRQDA